MSDEHNDLKEELGFDLPGPAKLPLGRGIAIGVVALVLLGGALAVGFFPRHRAKDALAKESAARSDAILKVDVITPKQLSSDRAMALPGTVEPLEETTVYPRASGYIRKWNVDIGDRVEEGAKLAEIDTPEVDQQLLQARAQMAQTEAAVVQAEANKNFAVTNLARYQQLAPAGVASQQELDQHQSQATVDEASVKVAKANLDAQRANVNRLLQLKSFAIVTAPFGGTVTARTIERGALVGAGNASPLFKIAAVDPVRIFVQVPQDVAPSIRNDVAATLNVREFPGRKFEGRVARSSGALDRESRTMLTEVRVPNPKGELIAGMYGQVELTLPSPHHVYELPATALITDANGTRVAIVTPEEKLHLITVAVERDMGATIQIAAGITGTERIVKLAGAELREGRQVEVTKPAPPEKK